VYGKGGMAKRPMLLEAGTELVQKIAALRDWQSLLQQFVECESPSHDKVRADECGRMIAAEFEKLGGLVRFYPQQEFGNVVQIDFAASGRKRPILLLGHIDTVYEAGSLEKMPCHVVNGKMYGPGVFDMKGGIVMMLLAIAALQQKHGWLPRPVTVLLNPDEEIGSKRTDVDAKRLIPA